MPSDIDFIENLNSDDPVMMEVFSNLGIDYDPDDSNLALVLSSLQPDQLALVRDQYNDLLEEDYRHTIEENIRYELPSLAKSIWEEKLSKLDEKWEFFFTEEMPKALDNVENVKSVDDLKALPKDPLTPFKLEAIGEIRNARRETRKELVEYVSKNAPHTSRERRYELVDEVASLSPQSPESALISSLPREMEKSVSQLRSAYAMKSGEINRNHDLEETLDDEYQIEIAANLSPRP